MQSAALDQINHHRCHQCCRLVTPQRSAPQCSELTCVCGHLRRASYQSLNMQSSGAGAQGCHLRCSASVCTTADHCTSPHFMSSNPIVTARVALGSAYSAFLRRNVHAFTMHARHALVVHAAAALAEDLQQHCLCMQLPCQPCYSLCMVRLNARGQPCTLQEQQHSRTTQILNGVAAAASAAVLLVGPLALDAQAVSGGVSVSGIASPLSGQDLSNQVGLG